MINAIAELGKFERRKNTDLSDFDIWLEDSFDKKNYPHLLLIVFKKYNDNWIYDGLEYREHSSSLKKRLLYKRGSSRGTDITPTCKTGNNIPNTFNQKIKMWFTQNKNSEFLNDEAKDFLSQIDKAIDNAKENIINELKEKQAEIDGGIVLSTAFLENGKLNLIGDIDFFTKFIMEESKNNYYKKYGTISIAEDKVCAVCNNKKAEVYGFFSTLAFYTVDKPGMVTGGFKQSKSWKNYPVCLDCALNIELGYNFLDKNLLFNFHGIRYYLIPKITNDTDKDEIIETILEYKKNPKISDKDKERITNAEDEVFDLLKDGKNNATFNLLFFEKPQKSVFRILALIEDVFPSRLKELFNTKEFVDNLVFFKNEVTKKGEPLYRFNFGILREFFPNNRIEGNHNKAFLELTDNIFSDKKISYEYLITEMMKKIRASFVKDEYFRINVYKSFMLLIFLNKLNLFRLIKKEESVDRNFFENFEIKSNADLEKKIEMFFDNFKNFFPTDVERAIFLLGVLAQFLLNIQYQDRNATPFRSKLKGLKMDARDISVLLAEIVEKLEQYNKNYYKTLEQVISKYLISAGNYRNWNLSVDEMNYIFVLGMNLSNYFKVKDDEKKEDTNE